MPNKFHNPKIEREEGYIVVHGDFKVLSSAVYNGGYVKARTIINLEVSEDFKGNAFELFNSFIKERGLEKKEVVGMMTAVPMNNAAIMEKGDITAIITAGMEKSTVNIILLIKSNISQSAMVNMIIVGTEAKAAAFFDLGVKDENGALFTGDSTDSMVIASYGYKEGEKEEIFAGKATELGRTVYEVIREGVKDAFLRYTHSQS